MNGLGAKSSPIDLLLGLVFTVFKSEPYLKWTTSYKNVNIQLFLLVCFIKQGLSV